MKCFLTALCSTVFLLTACHTAQTQSQPQVVVVPDDEMSRTPSVGPATTGTPGAPAPVASAAPATRPSSAPAAGRHSYNSCNVDGPYIAITFDDGPHKELTPKLLDMLKARGVKATFFVVGKCVVEYPEIMKRMVAEGHEVANHSWDHTALSKLSADGVRRQMVQTNDAIVKACGVTPTVMRPPYGATNSALNKKLDEEYGMKVILWSVDPLDWKYRNAERVSSQIIEGTQPGGIILVHDIHATSVAAMPKTIDTLLAKGYKFVTVSELIAMDKPLPPPTPKPSPSATAEATPKP